MLPFDQIKLNILIFDDPAALFKAADKRARLILVQAAGRARMAPSGQRYRCVGASVTSGPKWSQSGRCRQDDKLNGCTLALCHILAPTRRVF